ncbi:D-Ala-D-Ala carboxypeptidase family metallohydrolase [Sphingomonas sp. GCM10030256]|uniref:D-Ala-D-Ala carboxypeptidase family metallohydrolase n=1 Tax=Sphingomonas sp. GCM10030256 TaxID=3273427 RepID=UPI0036101AD8
MQRLSIGVAVLVSASAASANTDFGVRYVGAPPPARAAVLGAPPPSTALSVGPSAAGPSSLRTSNGRFSLSGVAGLGARYGRVTSTLRTPAHNRAVGGVRNSWHLSGRAVDIARRPGVTHAQIAAAFRASGYRLIESLDEGDHSHFAFASGGGASPAFVYPPQLSRAAEPVALTFRVVSGASGASR